MGAGIILPISYWENEICKITSGSNEKSHGEMKI